LKVPVSLPAARWKSVAPWMTSGSFHSRKAGADPSSSPKVERCEETATGTDRPVPGSMAVVRPITGPWTVRSIWMVSSTGGSGAVGGVDDELVAAVRQPLAEGGKQRRQVDGHARGAGLPGRPAGGGLAVVVGRGRERHGQRPRVEARGGRDLLVAEAGVDAAPGFGVVLRAQVAPDRRALRLAVTSDEGPVEERARHLVAAADGEDGLDERRSGNDVGR